MIILPRCWAGALSSGLACGSWSSGSASQVLELVWASFSAPLKWCGSTHIPRSFVSAVHDPWVCWSVLSWSSLAGGLATGGYRRNSACHLTGYMMRMHFSGSHRPGNRTVSECWYKGWLKMFISGHTPWMLASTGLDHLFWHLWQLSQCHRILRFFCPPHVSLRWQKKNNPNSLICFWFSLNISTWRYLINSAEAWVLFV